MSVREPAVAGQFYPGSRKQCEAEIVACLAQAGPPVGLAGPAVGGIVPHAGWVFSGAVAAEVIATLAAQPGIETFVVFGAMHRFVAAGGRGSYTLPGPGRRPWDASRSTRNWRGRWFGGSSILADDTDRTNRSIPSRSRCRSFSIWRRRRSCCR